MLNEAQRYLIKENIQILFFSEVEALPSKIQDIAYKSAMSFSFFKQNETILKEHNIDGCVSEVGRLLNHPFLQNPTTSSMDLGDKTALDPSLVLVQKGENNVVAIPVGALSLKCKDTPGREVTAEEVSKFVESLILSKLSSNFSIEEIQGREVAEEPSSNINPETFSKLAIDKQLKILGINLDENPKCHAENFLLFQHFMLANGAKRDSIDTIEKLNGFLKNWFEVLKTEYKELSEFVGEKNQKKLSLDQLIAARLAKFDTILPKNLNFYTYFALQRIAVSYGHTNVLESLKTDNCDIVRLLLKAKKYDVLERILTQHGPQMAHYHANFILVEYMHGVAAAQEMDSKVLNLLLKYTKITDSYKIRLLDFILLKKPKNIDVKGYLKSILSPFTFRLRMSLASSKEAFQIVASEDIEMQILVLTHSDTDFISRIFLNRETFVNCLKSGLLTAALKMAAMEYPRLLSQDDLAKAELFSKGALEIYDISVQSISFSYRFRELSTNNRHFLPMYNQPLQRGQLSPEEVLSIASQSLERPTGVEQRPRQNL